MESKHEKSRDYNNDDDDYYKIINCKKCKKLIHDYNGGDDDDFDSEPCGNCCLYYCKECCEIMGEKNKAIYVHCDLITCEICNDTDLNNKLTFINK